MRKLTNCKHFFVFNEEKMAKPLSNSRFIIGGINKKKTFIGKRKPGNAFAKFAKC